MFDFGPFYLVLALLAIAAVCILIAGYFGREGNQPTYGAMGTDPGSAQARGLGCICDPQEPRVYDGRNVWQVEPHCPVHGLAEVKAMLDDELTTCACGTDAGPPCPCPHGRPLCGPCEDCGRSL